MDRHTRVSALVVAAAVLLSPGCAANSGRQAADRQACEKLVAAVKSAFDSGSAPIEPDTAAFARARGLQANIVPDPRGGGEVLVPRSLPFPLMAAADPKDGGPRYQAAVASLTREYLQQLAEEGRRCAW